eukprot:scaffold3526_cov72-Skeletonema_dohrnii-CCMP3373.AAC.3
MQKRYTIDALDEDDQSSMQRESGDRWPSFVLIPTVHFRTPIPSKYPKFGYGYGYNHLLPNHFILGLGNTQYPTTHFKIKWVQSPGCKT